MEFEPVELLLRYLLNGGSVKHGGYEWAMSEDGSICVVIDDNKGHVVDTTVKQLKEMADDIGRHELWMMCCNLRLNGWTRRSIR